MQDQLAILGGEPVRRDPWPTWPVYGSMVKQAVVRVAESNVYCSAGGSEVEAFEREFAAYHGIAHAVAVANGTLALQLALAAAGIGCGDEVIVPAYTFIGTATAAIENSAIPRLVDSERITQGLDPADVRKKITPRTRAIMPVHINGYPCDMDAIMEIAREHKLIVIEDCAHAHGAEHRNRKVGTIGHFGCFSFQHKKNMSLGEGGMVITHDEHAARRMRDIRSFCWSPVTRNWRMGEFYGAVGREQIKVLDEQNTLRRRNVQTLLAALGKAEGIKPLPGLPDANPVYYNCVLRYDARIVGMSRKTFVEALNAEGVPVKMLYVPIQRWPTFTEVNFFGRGWPFARHGDPDGPVHYHDVATPVADDICDNINIEIKVQPTCGEREMKDAAAAIRKVLSGRDQLRALDKAV